MTWNVIHLTAELAALALLAWVLRVKILTRRELVHVRDLLQIAKDWAKSARAHNKDANLTLSEAKQAAPELGKLTAAVEQNPEKTAEKVVEKLGGSDVIKRMLLPPLLAVLTLTGATFAGGRAGAAERMREDNARAAIEWAGSTNGSR